MAERRLLHLLHHCPTPRLCRPPRGPLRPAVAAPPRVRGAAPPLLSSPPPPALPLLCLVPPDPAPLLPLLNAAVKALSASSPANAFRLLSTLRHLHAPDCLTFLPLLGCAASLPLLSALHSLVLRLGFLSHHAISLALLKPYQLPHARVLLEEIPQKNRCVVAYNTLVTRASGPGTSPPCATCLTKCSGTSDPGAAWFPRTL
ncbi:hypothetical protein U9M48_001121 [Paspalum notatum var. saurae]|uniref:Pentatricopeptide repeat-containing protein n=1 Tax=Paspalum notatum var. saurae TaxID=547442 RepID=A0AAQ3PIX8_PASNO